MGAVRWGVGGGCGGWEEWKVVGSDGKDATRSTELHVHSTHREATGEGWTASTSIPSHLTSGARLMANIERNALVEA